MKEQTLFKAFSLIYHNNLWDDNNSRSGGGSNMVQTQVIREKIPEIIANYKIKTIVDAPCGDLFWMKTLFPLFQREKIKYFGLDIVPEIIKQNNLSFSDPDFNFYNIDLTKGPIPCVDLIITRDCFLHLSYKNILAILTNYKESGSKYLLVSTYTKATRKNYDMNKFPVAYRPLNLQLTPFKLELPLEVIIEGCTEQNNEMNDKSLALWDLSQINLNEIRAAIKKNSPFQNTAIIIFEKVKKKLKIIINNLKRE